MAMGVHPDPAILALYAGGRLRDADMDRVEEHLAGCRSCLAAMEQIPEDATVRLLRDFAGQTATSSRQIHAAKTAEIDARGVMQAIEPQPPSPASEDTTKLFGPDDREAEASAPRDPLEHPRYRLKSVLGRGGMGLVYLADDRFEGRAVVVKFLRDDLLDHPHVVERFRREALAATRLKHPNILEAYGTEQFGQWPAIVMEYIHGTDLAQFVAQKGPLPIHVACELVRQAALGFQHSFEQGMVHRDVKPSNLMVTIDGTVKILDFGVAKLHSELVTDPGLTSTGTFLGSVDYMAPEQADDPRTADIRADIYSLGCTLYHFLSGGPPFDGETIQVLAAHQSIEASLLNEERSDVPAALAQIVAKMLAKNPADRYQAPDEVARALAPFSKATGAISRSPVSESRQGDRAASVMVTASLSRDDPIISIGAMRGNPPWRWSRLDLAWALGCTSVIILAGASIYWTAIGSKGGPSAELAADSSRPAIAKAKGKVDRASKIEAGSSLLPVKLVRSTAWPHNHIYYTTFSPDGRMYACGGDTGALRVWNLERGDQLGELPVSLGVFTHDGKHVLGYESDKTIILFDLADSREVSKWQTDTSVISLAIAPDGKQFVSGHTDGKLRLWEFQPRLWEFQPGRERRTLSGHRESPTAVFSPDGKQILSASPDKTVSLWNVETGALVRTFGQFRGATPMQGTDLIVQAAFLPGGKQIAGYVWGTDKTLLIWDAESGDVLKTFDLGADHSKDLAISPDGRWFLTAHENRTLRLRDLKTGEDVQRLQTAEALPRAPTFSPDGRFIVSGSYRGWVYLWQLSAASEERH
jgi:serine/threonine protein kinase